MRSAADGHVSVPLAAPLDLETDGTQMNAAFWDLFRKGEDVELIPGFSASF